MTKLIPTYIQDKYGRSWTRTYSKIKASRKRKESIKTMDKKHERKEYITILYIRKNTNIRKDVWTYLIRKYDVI